MALRDEGEERDWVYSYEKRSEMNREERAEFGCHCACGGLALRGICGDLFTDARKTGMSGVGACARPCHAFGCGSPSCAARFGAADPADGYDSIELVNAREKKTLTRWAPPSGD
jgi:hypothetical protein